LFRQFLSVTEFRKEDVTLVGRLTLTDSHSNAPIDFRMSAHGDRLYSPFKIQFSIKKHVQKALRYPKDHRRLEMIYVSPPLEPEAQPFLCGQGNYLPCPAAQPSCTQICSSLPWEDKKETAAWDSSVLNLICKLE